ncbi:hypothetical protein VTK73DRAFT_3645 [Phialemonium thermophilum]|uniref:Uncharacterized protein n=1 Tax=Phialemonium thermophilum TaxID=223376 RepID=A0ABR3VH65_9PEZI
MVTSVATDARDSVSWCFSLVGHRTKASSATACLAHAQLVCRTLRGRRDGSPASGTRRSWRDLAHIVLAVGSPCGVAQCRTQATEFARPVQNADTLPPVASGWEIGGERRCLWIGACRALLDDGLESLGRSKPITTVRSLGGPSGLFSRLGRSRPLPLRRASTIEGKRRQWVAGRYGSWRAAFLGSSRCKRIAKLGPRAHHVWLRKRRWHGHFPSWIGTVCGHACCPVHYA